MWLRTSIGSTSERVDDRRLPHGDPADALPGNDHLPTRVPGERSRECTLSQTIALAPLSDPEISALITELLGPDPSITGLGQKIGERAAGNPFFAEEIVWELAERGVSARRTRHVRVDGTGC